MAKTKSFSAAEGLFSQSLANVGAERHGADARPSARHENDAPPQIDLEQPSTAGTRRIGRPRKYGLVPKTLYITEEQDRRLQLARIDERREMSEIVRDALDLWFGQ